MKRSARREVCVERSQPIPRAVSVGNVEAIIFAWDASPDANPADSGARLAAQVDAWLHDIALSDVVGDQSVVLKGTLCN